MFKVGLTGGIASGKSTICQLFSQHNIPIIDADIIARQLVEPNKDAFKEIVQLFGKEILQNDGTLNRKQLRQLIFSNTKSKQQLESILHPRIRQQLLQQSEQQHANYCILVIPLLVEANMSDLVDHIVVVDAEEEQQLKRLCQRDNISLSDAQSIIKNQSSREERLTIADDIIVNNNSTESLSQIINELHKKYCNLAKNIQL